MPLSFSDVNQLATMTLAISALGVGVDGIMVPRLERLRDVILNKCFEVFSDDENNHAFIEAKKGNGDPTLESVAKEYERLSGIKDDLTEALYFEELASKFFLNGSIVRVFLVTMVLNVLLLVISVLMQGGYTQRCIAYGVCNIDYLILLSLVSIVYLTAAYVVYVRKWKNVLDQLSKSKVEVTTALHNLKIHLKLIARKNPPAT